MIRSGGRGRIRSGRWGRRVVLSLGISLALVAVSVISPSPAVAKGTRLVWDDFRNGFTTTGPSAKWFYFAAGPYVGDDGRVSTSNKGLRVLSSGTNPATGEPAFVRTIGQEDDNGGLPGGLDHVKWLAYMNHVSSAGVPGFDAPSRGSLAFETWIGGQTYGTEGHPFGAAVQDPEDDLRLGSFAMNTIDFESFMVFDFFLTNKRIYAFYERLPFGRTVSNNYAAFSFMKPVADRSPSDRHHLKISYDRSAGTVKWLIDDDEVMSVDRLGYRIDRELMTIDHGGTEELVAPRQLNGGMGTFTLLDGHLPSGQGLVRLSSAPNAYFDPSVGEPAPETFVDEESRPTSRLFGQGAGMQIKRYLVTTGRS